MTPGDGLIVDPFGHVLGGAILWLPVGLSVGTLVYIATLVGPWSVAAGVWSLFWVFMACCAAVLVGTALLVRLPTGAAPDSGGGA